MKRRGDPLTKDSFKSGDPADMDEESEPIEVNDGPARDQISARVIKKPVSKLGKSGAGSFSSQSNPFAAFSSPSVTFNANAFDASKTTQAPAMPNFSFGSVDQKPAFSAQQGFTFTPVSFDMKASSSIPAQAENKENTVSMPSSVNNTKEIETYFGKLAGLNYSIFEQLKKYSVHFEGSKKSVNSDTIRDFSPIFQCYIKHLSTINTQHSSILNDVRKMMSGDSKHANGDQTATKVAKNPFAGLTPDKPPKPAEPEPTPDILQPKAQFSFGNVSPSEVKAPVFTFGTNNASDLPKSASFSFSTASSASAPANPAFTLATQDSSKNNEDLSASPSKTAAFSFGSGLSEPPAAPKFTFGSSSLHSAPNNQFIFGSGNRTENESTVLESSVKDETKPFQFSFGQSASPLPGGTTPHFSFGNAFKAPNQSESGKDAEEGGEDEDEDAPLEVEKPKIGAGEESEITEHEIRCKLYKYENQSIADKGVNYMKINHDPANGTWRFLARQEGSSAVSLNARITKQVIVQPVVGNDRLIAMLIPEMENGQVKISKYHIRVKESAFATAFLDAVKSIQDKLS